jgi:hypothetical protein
VVHDAISITVSVEGIEDLFWSSAFEDLPKKAVPAFVLITCNLYVIADAVLGESKKDPAKGFWQVKNEPKFPVAPQAASIQQRVALPELSPKAISVPLRCSFTY